MKPTHLLPYVEPARGPRWRSWLRQCATSQKVAGSIHDGVTGIFHWHNPSGRTMALGSTQPLTEMSTGNISWGVKSGRCVGADNLTTFMCRLSWNLGTSASWDPLGLFRPVMGLLYLLCRTASLQTQRPSPSPSMLYVLNTTLQSTSMYPTLYPPFMLIKCNFMGIYHVICMLHAPTILIFLSQLS